MMRMLLMVIMLACAVAGVDAQPGKAEIKVRKALEAGKPYKAIRACDHQLIDADAPTVFLVLRADAFNRIGEYEKALRDAKRARAAALDDREVRSQLMAAYLGMDHADSALSCFEDLADDGADEEFMFRMGTTYQRLRRCSDAIAVYDRMISRFPTSARAWRERGSCQAERGDSALARADLDKAIELAPRDPANYNSRAFYRYALFGDHRRAIADYDRAVKLNPNYSYAFNNRGWSLYKLGEKDQALKDIDLARRKNRHNPYVFRNLGVIALDEGDKEAACRQLRYALAEGFTPRFGNEVEDLVREHCGEVATPRVTTAPPPSNAPERTINKSNAP